MGKKVLVLSTSPRKGSNSEILADEFIRGAQSAGHSVEKINISSMEIRYCMGCLGCQNSGRCASLQGWIDCFEKARLAGVLHGGNVTAPGEVRGQNELLQKAFSLGNNI